MTWYGKVTPTLVVNFLGDLMQQQNAQCMLIGNTVTMVTVKSGNQTNKYNNEL